MDRFLLEVYCPANSKTYEFWISKNMCVGDAAVQIALEIGEYEQNKDMFGHNSEAARLYCMDSGSALPFHRTMRQSGVQSGFRLMIV